jgi:hypothetical protein
MDDQELRDRFDDWARPLRETPVPAVAALRTRIRRRMAGIAAATASVLAVAGVAIGSLAAAAGGHSGKAPPHPPSQLSHPAPPGQPYVFVNSSATFANQGANTPTTPAELKNAATGRVVKILRPIGQGVSFTTAAAAPGDRLFVLAEQDGDGTLSFAEVQIGASGKPTGLLPVLTQLSMPAGTQAENMTVNAAGTRLAFYASAPNGDSGNLVVFNLLTGATIGSWPVASSGVALEQFLGSGDKLLVAVAGVAHGQNRFVDTSTAFRAGSSLLADSRPGYARGFPGSFTQDGNMWMNTNYGRVGGTIVPVYGAPVHSSGSEVLEEFSAATGKLVRKIPIGPASALTGPYFCGVLWASANGAEILTQCGSRQLRITGPVPPGVCLPSQCAGHVTQVKLAWPLPANDNFGISAFAW